MEHPNKISCEFFDTKNKNLVRQRCDSTLQEYFKSKLNSEPVKKSWTVPHHDAHPSKYHQKIDYFNPFWGRIVRQMLKYVVDMHFGGKSLAPFTLADIGILGDDLKFLYVPLVEDNPFQRRKNFKNVEAVITELFELDKGKSCPGDLADIRQKLKHDFNGTWYEFAMLNHLAIITPTDALKFIIKLGMEIADTTWENDRMNSFVKISANSCYGWNEKIHNKLGPLKNCWVRGQDLGTVYTYHGMASSVKKSLFQCARNLAVHLSDWKNWPSSVAAPTDLHVLLLIMHVFGEQIHKAHLQVCELTQRPQFWFE